MKEVKTGTKVYTTVFATDTPDDTHGGACHEYQVVISTELKPGSPLPEPVAEIAFQRGPVNECGINGCHNEDLISIVVDRLQAFQAGKFSCRENALALTKLEEALHWLNHRTKDRAARGVEGTSQK
jgi:hypothetical protein